MGNPFARSLAACLAVFFLITWGGRVRAADTAPAGDADDTVYLDDGTTLTGLVTAQEPGKYVTIQTSAGEQTLPWAHVSRVVIAPAHVTHTNVHHDKGGGYGLEVGGTFVEAEAKRRAWKQRGGDIFSFSIQGEASGILMPQTNLPEFTPNGTPIPGRTGVGRGGGGGGGAGGRIAYLHLTPPDPTTLSNTWIAWRIGTGADVAFFDFRQPTLWVCSSASNCSSGSAQYAGTSMTSFTFPLELGAQIGLGGFGDASNWSGLVLGLNYAPSYSYSLVSGSGSGTFNAAGFSITFDITSLEAKLDEYAKPAHFRISVFILPPIGSSIPLFGTLGFGAAWY